jgi:hypothetical protein
MARCAICKFPLQDDDEIVHCPECGTPYHKACWESIGGCAVYGCQAAATPDVKPAPQVVGKGWGDEKRCPKCSRPLASSLLVCTCGARFPWAEPMSAQEYNDWLEGERQRQTKRNWLVGLFLITLFALPAPVTGAVAGYYAYRNRADLSGQYGAFLALGYGTAAIGLLYLAILIAIF